MASVDFHRSEESEQIAGDIAKQPGNKKNPVRKNNQHHKYLLEVILKVQSQEFYFVKNY